MFKINQPNWEAKFLLLQDYKYFGFLSSVQLVIAYFLLNSILTLSYYTTAVWFHAIITHVPPRTAVTNDISYWGEDIFILPTSTGSSKKRIPEFQKKYFCFIDYATAFDCVDHNKLWKILKEMGIPDHLTCLLRNLLCRSGSNS